MTTSLTAQPICTTTYTQGSPVGGSYSTSCSGAASGNYQISYAAGSVSVNKANADCTPIHGYTGIYDGAAHGATGACAGVPSDPSAVGSSLDLGGTFTNVPGGTAHWAFTGGTNYNDQSGNVAITISKAQT